MGKTRGEKVEVGGGELRTQRKNEREKKQETSVLV